MPVKKQSAGTLLYRKVGIQIEVLLVHPGGPYWSNKDQGAWSIPKGEIEGNEDLLAGAKREFTEETGQPAPGGIYKELNSFTRADGKQIYAWAVEGDLNTENIKSNTFQMEWPPKSGSMKDYPEIDKVAWFEFWTSIPKLHKGQDSFMYELAKILGIPHESVDHGDRRSKKPLHPDQASLF